MNGDDVLVKTVRGVQALRTRSAELPQRLRTALILVDGTRTVAMLHAAASQAGAPPECLDVLVEQGLVQLQERGAWSVLQPAEQPHPMQEDPPMPLADRYGAAVRIINEAVVDAMGLRAFFMSLKIEKCASPGDLLALLPDITRAVSKSRGAFAADALERRVRSLLQ